MGLGILVPSTLEAVALSTLALPRFEYYRFTALEVRDKGTPSAPGIARIVLHRHDRHSVPFWFSVERLCDTELGVQVIGEEGQSITFSVSCEKQGYLCGKAYDGWFFETVRIDPLRDTRHQQF